MQQQHSKAESAPAGVQIPYARRRGKLTHASSNASGETHRLAFVPSSSPGSTGPLLFPPLTRSTPGCLLWFQLEPRSFFKPIRCRSSRQQSGERRGEESERDQPSSRSPALRRVAALLDSCVPWRLARGDGTGREGHADADRSMQKGEQPEAPGITLSLLLPSNEWPLDLYDPHTSHDGPMRSSQRRRRKAEEKAALFASVESHGGEGGSLLSSLSR